MEEQIKMHEEAIKNVRKHNKTELKVISFLLLTIVFFGFSINIVYLIFKIPLLVLGIFFLTKFFKNLSNYIEDLIFYFIENNKKEKNVELENNLISQINLCNYAITNDKTCFVAKRAFKEAESILEKHYYEIPMTTVFAAEDELKKLKKVLQSK